MFNGNIWFLVEVEYNWVDFIKKFEWCKKHLSKGYYEDDKITYNVILTIYFSRCTDDKIGEIFNNTYNVWKNIILAPQTANKEAVSKLLMGENKKTDIEATSWQGLLSRIDVIDSLTDSLEKRTNMYFNNFSVYYYRVPANGMFLNYSNQKNIVEIARKLLEIDGIRFGDDDNELEYERFNKEGILLRRRFWFIYALRDRELNIYIDEYLRIHFWNEKENRTIYINKPLEIDDLKGEIDSHIR